MISLNVRLAQTENNIYGDVCSGVKLHTQLSCGLFVRQSMAAMYVIMTQAA